MNRAQRMVFVPPGRHTGTCRQASALTKVAWHPSMHVDLAMPGGFVTLLYNGKAGIGKPGPLLRQLL